MSETTTVTTETTTDAQAMPKELETTPGGLKVYPTSFLPEKSHIEPSRIPTAKMTGFQIEVAHVIIFFALTIGLFYSMWKRPNKR